MDFHLNGYVWGALSAGASAMATLLIKLSHRANAGWTLSRLAYLGSACGSYGLGFICYTLTLHSLDISLAYPLIVAFTLLLILLIGSTLLGERLSRGRIVGALMIMIGAFLLGR